MDNNITLDERSIDYIIRRRCDHAGCLKYLDVIKDMVIRTKLDQGGKLIWTWQMKQVAPKDATQSCSDQASLPQGLRSEKASHTSTVPEETEVEEELTTH